MARMEIISGIECKAVEQSVGNLGVTEDRGPFAEAEVGGDDDAGALIKLAQQVEGQRSA